MLNCLKINTINKKIVFLVVDKISSIEENFRENGGFSIVFEMENLKRYESESFISINKAYDSVLKEKIKLI